ncbi:MAG: amidohydrolase family protein, partial [Clostridia bacterium]
NVLGESERISVLDALRAVTINAAHQYFEEDTKGSICIGKHADFVVLDDNPITVHSDKIADINILMTIKDGKTLYRQK